MDSLVLKISIWMTFRALAWFYFSITSAFYGQIDETVSQLLSQQNAALTQIFFNSVPSRNLMLFVGYLAVEM